MPERTPSERTSTGQELSFPELYTEAHLEQRNLAISEEDKGWAGVDATDPKCPAGHQRGMRISVAITSNYREVHRKDAMDIKPQDLIDVLTAAGVTKWVLMGLHGYVGYLPQPRATQDVDVLIATSDRKRAVRAVQKAWPELVKQELEVVIRFKDPNDCFADGEPKTVIDLMLPWSQLSQAILDQYSVVDEDTGNRIPTVEGALASKFSAMVSRNREWDKKQQDAVDFRRIARANYGLVDRDALRRLGDLVWDRGGEELERFLEIAQRDESFPV